MSRPSSAQLKKRQRRYAYVLQAPARSSSTRLVRTAHSHSTLAQHTRTAHSHSTLAQHTRTGAALTCKTA